MIGSLIFFITSFVLGLVILEFAKIILPSFLKIILALTIGVFISVLVIFTTSLIFGLNLPNILIINSLLFFPSIMYLGKKPHVFNFLGKIEVKKNLFSIGVLLILSLFIIIIFAKSIYVNENGIVAGNRLVWTDWPVHLAIISSFVHGDNFPPTNPLYAGKLISYPFLSDFLSSILQVLGASLKVSLVLPGIIFGFLIVVLLYYLGILISKEKNIAAFGLFVAVFWGGVGFWYFFQDLATSANFWQTLTYPPHEYTFYQEKNLWFFSFLYSELLPQRSFLLGAPMFLASLILLILGITKNQKSPLLVSGFLVGLMPFSQMHSFISFLLLITVFTPLSFISSIKTDGLKRAKEQFGAIILYFILPIFVLGLIQVPLFLNISTSQVLGFNWGWLKGNENFLLFWFKNTGFFIPLLIFAFFKTKFSTIEKNLLFASSALFILPNVIRFAPWPYDNLKIMTYWYFIGAFFVAKALNYFFQKKFLGKTLAVFLFLALTLSGIIEVTRVFNTDKTKISLWSKEDIDLVRTIIEKTPASSIILTAAIHDHPLTALAGRKIVIGFPGNAWSWGLADWAQREADVRTMLRGEPASLYLFQKYNVAYVLVSPRERYFDSQLNEEYFAQNYTFVTGGSDYKLYRIK